jgi:hypothetical protein
MVTIVCARSAGIIAAASRPEQTLIFSEVFKFCWDLALGNVGHLRNDAIFVGMLRFLRFLFAFVEVGAFMGFFRLCS